ncbi:MAG: hypothetical protein KJ583_02540 [Nanoarchaeota archaeon]|nr:hypothetical protein [Nanoarchaeota archaeon]MBU2443073.1 hypothetical protein [Nanoarchaeota archaeon]
MFNKKGQGISINVIIIAAIALLVLVILSVLLIRSGGNVVTGTSCAGVGGTCSSSCSDLSEGTKIYSPHPTAKCTDSNDKCCIILG